MADIFTPEYFDNLLRGGQPGASSRLASSLPAEALSAEGQAARAAAAARAIPTAAPVAAAPPAGLAYNAGRLVGRGFGALTRLAAPLALGSMAAGAGEKALNPQNASADVVERGLEIASGADITGFGAWLGSKLTGRVAPTAAPATGAHATPERSAFTSAAAPAADPLAGPLSPKDLQADIQSRSEAADQLFGAVDTMIGRSGGTTAGANERIRNLVSNPAALETFNAAQGLNRTGIVASRDAKGQLRLAGDPNAQQNVYVGADGKPTTRWEDTQQFADATALAAKERAQLGALETKGELADQLTRVRGAKTVTGKNLETQLYKIMSENQVNRETALRLGAVEGHKAGVEERKLQLDAIKTMADAGDKNAQTLVRQLTLRAVAKGDTDTALLLQGKEPRADSNVFLPTLNDKEVFVGNKATGAVSRVTVPQRATEANIQASMTAQGLTRAQAIEAYRKRGFDVAGIK